MHEYDFGPVLLKYKGNAYDCRPINMGNDVIAVSASEKM